MGNRVEVRFRQVAGVAQVRVSDDYDRGSWRDLPCASPSVESDPAGFLASLVDAGDDILDAALENDTDIDLPHAQVSAIQLQQSVDAYRAARALEDQLPLPAPASLRPRV